MHEDYCDELIDTPRVREAAAIVKKLFKDGGCYRAWHIVIEDLNIEDNHVAYCVECLDDPAYHVTDSDRALAPYFTAMSEDERGSAIMIAEGRG